MMALQTTGMERMSRNPYPQPIAIHSQRSLSPQAQTGRAPRRPSRSRASFSSNGRASSSMPAMDGLVLLSKSSAAYGSALEDDEDDDDDFDFDEDGVPQGRRGSHSHKLGKGGDQYQCEKCGKYYRHPACLTKHRWQHTEFWAEASKFMLSKHQSVQMLEAAAILINGHAMPDEKSLWPAAVSPPSSGLLGSEQLNSDVLSRQKVGSSPLSGPSLVLPTSEGKPREHDDTSSDEEGSSAMDVDSRMDDGDMFNFELGEEGGSAGTSGPEDGNATMTRHAAKGASAALDSRDSRISPFHAAHAAHHARLPAEFGVSAPQLGFFAVRQ